MKLNDLKDGQVVLFRIGRYVDGQEEPRWTEWFSGPIRLERRAFDLPKQLRRMSQDWRKGDIINLVPLGIECTSFSQSDWQESCKVFLVEDYYLEIEGLE